ILEGGEVRQVHAGRLPRAHRQAGAVERVRSDGAPYIWLAELCVGVGERAAGEGPVVRGYGVVVRGGLGGAAGGFLRQALLALLLKLHGDALGCGELRKQRVTPGADRGDLALLCRDGGSGDLGRLRDLDLSRSLAAHRRVRGDFCVLGVLAGLVGGLKGRLQVSALVREHVSTRYELLRPVRAEDEADRSEPSPVPIRGRRESTQI